MATKIGPVARYRRSLKRCANQLGGLCVTHSLVQYSRIFDALMFGSNFSLVSQNTSRTPLEGLSLLSSARPPYVLRWTDAARGTA